MSDSSSSSEEEFFNLSKPRKKTLLPPQGRQARLERLEKRHKNPNEWNVEDVEAEPEYYVAIQRQERERMAHGQSQMMEENVSQIGALSQFEVDTLGGRTASSLHNATISSKKPSDNLR